jgi:hypothetical protein
MPEELLGPISAEMFEHYCSIRLLNVSKDVLLQKLKIPYRGNRRTSTFLVNRNFEIIVSDNIIHSGLRNNLGLYDLNSVLLQGRIFLNANKTIGFEDVVFMQYEPEEKRNHLKDFNPNDVDKIQIIVEDKIKSLFQA